ncbi:MAG: hypothetical protein C7B47_16745 [Sulfobacillus thermosulfidooxidans]|uniref:Uncharacterized protein n=1 Tax=Sulfobacillus thermosulfidooxidans TaxID=28034 RepID=A0A2T2WJC9_SULTH|nr:MAG: hypothetical protein C7B47_16745 [Sulfobacillus thermosulfidooxidans]
MENNDRIKLASLKEQLEAIKEMSFGNKTELQALSDQVAKSEEDKSQIGDAVEELIRNTLRNSFQLRLTEMIQRIDNLIMITMLDAPKETGNLIEGFEVVASLMALSREHSSLIINSQDPIQQFSKSIDEALKVYQGWQQKGLHD